MEIAAARPASRLDRVSDRVGRGMVEIDTARKQFLVFGDEPRQFERVRRLVYPRDQQALAATGSEEFDRVGNARGATGEDHNSICFAIEGDFSVRYAIGKPEKAGDQGGADENDERKGGSPDRLSKRVCCARLGVRET